MIIFQKILELVKAVFGITIFRSELSPLFNFFIFFAFFFSIILIFYWFYLEKRVPIFRGTWKERFQVAREAKAGIQIKDVQEELKEILSRAKEEPLTAFSKMLELLEEILILFGYEEGDLKEKIESVSPLLLNLETKKRAFSLIEIKKKWEEKLKIDRSFNLPKSYLKKIFHELLSIFKSLKFIPEEEFMAWVQGLPFEEASDLLEESPV